MLYFIKYVAKKIFISELDQDRFIPLKKMGEEWQEFTPEFWEWFKNKIDYQNEALSFIIVSDSKEFMIDPSIKLANINNAYNNSMVQNLLSQEIIAHTELSFMPPSDYSIPPIEEYVEKDIPNKKIKKESLSEYYMNKTKLYKGL